jgi:hypothetical protein
LFVEERKATGNRGHHFAIDNGAQDIGHNKSAAENRNVIGFSPIVRQESLRQEHVTNIEQAIETKDNAASMVLDGNSY